jgi:hypothetical protein
MKPLRTIPNGSYDLHPMFFANSQNSSTFGTMWRIFPAAAGSGIKPPRAARTAEIQQDSGAYLYAGHDSATSRLALVGTALGGGLTVRITRNDIAILPHWEKHPQLDHRPLLLDDVSHIAGDNAKISA